MGAGYTNMGVSNISEGVQDIYNGITGNVDVQAFNTTRDTFFGGNQTYYNQAEVVLGATKVFQNILIKCGMNFGG